MAEPKQEVESLLGDYIDVWNEADYSKLPDVVDESIDVFDPGAPGGELHGRDALEGFIREIRTGFPDFEVRLGDVLAADDIVMAEWTATGTHEGEFNGIPPTERELELEGMDKFLLEDGKLQEHRIYYDLQGMLEQLGVAEQ